MPPHCHTAALTKCQGDAQLLQRLPDAPLNVFSGQAASLAQRNPLQQRKHPSH